MTLTDMLQAISMDNAAAEFMEKCPEMTLCDLINSCLVQAARGGRLIHGLNDCATALSSNPDDVVVCILPLDNNCSDVNRNIQMLLIESVCLEYDIQILKLDMNVLGSGLAASTGALDVPPSPKLKKASVCSCECTSELDCFLIQHGEDGLSNSDKKLLHTFQDVWDDAPVNGFSEFPE